MAEYLVAVLIGYEVNILLFGLIVLLVFTNSLFLNKVKLLEMNMTLSKLQSRYKYLMKNSSFKTKSKYFSFLFPYSGIFIFFMFLRKSFESSFIAAVIDELSERIDYLEKNLSS